MEYASRKWENAMKLHEYQAKEILSRYGVNVPKGLVVSSAAQAKQYDKSEAVIKIQVHAGGRGKAGGVILAKTKDEITNAVEKLIGMKMVNQQTGPDGVIAHQVLIEPLANIAKEYYLACVIDRDQRRAVLIASPEGGMEIEEIAAETPEKILTLPLKYTGGLKNFQHLQLAKFMGWDKAQARQAKQLVNGLIQAFLACDASLLEINPLGLTTEGEIIALDAKFGIDPNALFRQESIAHYYDPSQVDPNEAKANEYDLAYIALDGNVGCMVNGAGLAMATMDIIDHYGGRPANFLDVGGSATKEKVAEGFKILLSDPKVKAILVNIFGGIMNCGTLAAGIVSAANELKPQVPLVVRMEGTNVSEGKKILASEKALNIIVADDLASAAEKAVEVVKI